LRGIISLAGVPSVVVAAAARAAATLVVFADELPDPLGLPCLSERAVRFLGDNEDIDYNARIRQQAQPVLVVSYDHKPG
jgi:hypothetical protein